MAFEVKKAKRQRRPLKISLEGLSGSGKTYTALRLAFEMKRAGIGKRIVVADSENESAGLYDGVHIDNETWQYEVCPIPHDKQNPVGYAECYEYLVGEGFDIIIFDSLSHAWHGAQEKIDAYSRANKGDKFGGWAQVTPQQREMLTTLTDPRAHCIVTMRVKSEYERVDVGGKSQIKKVGMKTDQRDGSEYEFDCVVRLDEGHSARVEKVRGCTQMDRKTGDKPGPEFWKPLLDWWLSAEAVLSPEEQHRRDLNAAKTLADLATAWGAVPKALQPKLVGDKDARKAKLSQPANQTPTAAAQQPIGDDETDEDGNPIAAGALFPNPKPQSGVPH